MFVAPCLQLFFYRAPHYTPGLYLFQKHVLRRTLSALSIKYASVLIFKRSRLYAPSHLSLKESDVWRFKVTGAKEVFRKTAGMGRNSTAKMRLLKMAELGKTRICKQCGVSIRVTGVATIQRARNKPDNSHL